MEKKKQGCGKQMGIYTGLVKSKIVPYCGEILTNYNDGEENTTRLCEKCEKMTTEKPLSEKVIFEGNCEAIWKEDIAEAVDRLKRETFCVSCNRWIKLCKCAYPKPAVMISIINKEIGDFK